jgi:hypothetical protein
MGSGIQIRVDRSLQEILADIQKNIAQDIKKKYGLEKITIYGTAASKIAAAKLSGKTVLNFKIEKVGLNNGVLKLL